VSTVWAPPERDLLIWVCSLVFFLPFLNKSSAEDICDAFFFKIEDEVVDDGGDETINAGILLFLGRWVVSAVRCVGGGGAFRVELCIKGPLLQDVSTVAVDVGEE